MEEEKNVNAAGDARVKKENDGEETATDHRPPQNVKDPAEHIKEQIAEAGRTLKNDLW